MIVTWPGPHDGDGIGDGGLADDDSRGVGAHIAGDILEVFGEFEHPLEAFTGDFGIAEFGAFSEGFVEAFGIDTAVDFFGEESDEGVWERRWPRDFGRICG